MRLFGFSRAESEVRVAKDDSVFCLAASADFMQLNLDVGQPCLQNRLGDSVLNGCECGDSCNSTPFNVYLSEHKLTPH